MAERIVVELRHKISSGEAFEAIAGAAGGGGGRAELRDAVLALVALGYKQDDAHKKVMQVTGAHPEAVDVESIIKFAISK